MANSCGMVSMLDWMVELNSGHQQCWRILGCSVQLLVEEEFFLCVLPFHGQVYSAGLAIYGHVTLL